MWKIPNKATSNCVNIQFREHPRQEWKSEVPRMGKRRLASRTLYENSFAVVGPQLWKTLSPELNIIYIQNTFKNKLTDYIKRLSDELPVKGYSRSHNNTLQEVQSKRGNPVEEGQPRR